MQYTLKTPLKPGFRRSLKLVPDEAVDKLDNGQLASFEVLQGADPAAITFLVDPSSTEKEIKCFAYGDGPLGDKVVRVHADGHIGDGLADITIDIGFTVFHPDATAFGPVMEGTDEPIPAA